MADDRGKGTWRTKDGQGWRIGTAEEVRWIQETPVGQSVADAVPPIFEAYATLEQPLTGGSRTDWEAAREGNGTLVVETWERQESALLGVLAGQTDPQPWWLGYLETGSSDVVFPDAPRVQMYAGWGYVLVEAGPDQAAAWRENDWSESLPDVMFPADRSWLVTTLWDDDWTCIGGRRTLVDAVLSHLDLAERTREVDRSMSMDEACPPGHEYF